VGIGWVCGPLGHIPLSLLQQGHVCPPCGHFLNPEGESPNRPVVKGNGNQHPKNRLPDQYRAGG